MKTSLTFFLFLCFPFLLICQNSSNFRMGPVFGGVTNTNAKVFAAVDSSSLAILEYDIDEFFSNPTTLSLNSTSSFNRLMFELVDLDSDTKYYVRIYKDENPLDTINGSFSTFPDNEEVKDFTFTFGSCMNSEPMYELFNNMISDEPRFFIQTGDFTYPDGRYGLDFPILDSIMDLSYVDKYTYEGIIPFLSSTPIDYVYDDHDYVDNNSGKTTYSVDSVYEGANGVENYLMEKPLLPQARAKAIEGYINYFPSYELPDTANGIYHSFRYGQAEFFVIDNRSNRSPNLEAFEYDNTQGLSPWQFNPSEDHTILGVEQMNWLLNELGNSDATWKFIVSGVTFNKSIRRLIDFGIAVQWLTLDVAGSSGSGLTLSAGFSDSWCGFPADQDKLIDFVRNNNLENVILLTGDTHTSAIDDGLNSGIPEFNSSNLQPNPNTSGIYGIIDSVGATLGQPSVLDSMWNKGASGLNNDNTNPGYGRVEIFGNDSARLCQVDYLGDAFNCWTFPAGYKNIGTVSNIEKLMNNPAISLYPNPTKNILNIDLDYHISKDENYSWKVIDFIGKTHLTGNVLQENISEENITLSINIESLSSGYYFMSILDGAKQWNKMFVKE